MAAKLLVISDFDGTISSQDSLKELFDRYAGVEWRLYEKAIRSHQMTEKEGLQLMLDTLNCSFDEAVSFVLEHIQIDQSFKDFVYWCREFEIPLFVLSGGFIELIQPILRREGLHDLPVYANSFFRSDGRWLVSARHSMRFCNDQWHCKCASMSRIQSLNQSKVVYIGDGHTDRCASAKADFIFAKSFLAEHLRQQKKEFRSFESFRSVLSELKLMCGSATEAA